MRLAPLPLTVLFPALLVACGASDAPAPAAAAPPTPTAAPAASTPAPVASTAASAAPPTTVSYSDPNESDSPIRLTPLFAAGAPATTFPKATAADVGCLGHATLKGDNARDFPAVLAACGSPTGLAEYANRMTGMLSSAFDKTDGYVIALAPGYCYRVFATSDQTMFDLDLSIQPAAGGSKIEDGARGPVAILDNDKPLCVDQGGDYAISLAVDNGGYGGYTVGVWARPAQSDAAKTANVAKKPAATKKKK